MLEHHADPPVTLIGFSWGAWLSFIVTARYPDLIKKLWLVGSAPFAERYVPELQAIRLSRLSEAERREWATIIQALAQPGSAGIDTLLARLGTLASKTDTYDPIEADEIDRVGYQGYIFQHVWNAAAELCRNGQLLALGRDIHCPVTAVHGDYDPHPAEGVQRPLSVVLKHFRFVLLERCGHTPWLERQARENFYRIIQEEL